MSTRVVNTKKFKKLETVLLNSVRVLTVLLVLFASAPYHKVSAQGVAKPAVTVVQGQNYQVCNETAQYLTSPWTYSGAVNDSGPGGGSQSYTVSQYEALPGYDTTLPPLPSYISNESSTTEAAVIFTPGADVNLPAYDFTGTPILYFFEGGAYGEISLQTISGDEFIGGSAAGFPEPTFNDGGNAAGINAQNGSYDYAGGNSTLASTASAGATTLTTTSTIPGYTNYVQFPDGTSYQVASSSGTSITLDTGLTSTESSGTTVWGNAAKSMGVVSASASQGATTVTLGASSTPFEQWADIVIGTNNYQIQSVSGSQSGYTLTLTSGLDAAVSANTPFYYNGLAGNVTVKYLNISNDIHVSDGTLYTGSGWTITNNDIHDGYSSSIQGGVAILGGDESTIEYNCISKMGQYAFNLSGTNDTVNYNEVYQTNYEKIIICGCAGAGKWWGTLNANIVDNAFVEDDIGTSGITIWLDNGNSGTLISGNYFYKDYSNAISNETGYNSDITGNLFLDSGWGSGSGPCSGGSNCGGAITINSSGGINVPGSRYENQFLVQNNTLYNDWQGIDFWQSAAQRNCMVSGEGTKGATGDSDYCSGGFPVTATMAANNAGTINYNFSHYQFTSNQGTNYMPAVVGGCSSSCSQIIVSASSFPTQNTVLAIHDQIGFSDPALVTDTTDSMAVSSCTSSTPCTLTVSSTSGFPSSGKLLADTTNADAKNGAYTGAILSYTGTTSTTFTGVQLVTCSSSSPSSTCGGSGSLLGSAGSQLQEIEPYEVTDETCYTNTCKVTVSPAIPSVSAGTTVDQSGTCRLFLTSSATPMSPLAPNGVSYFDGCQWLVKNVTVSSNTFVFQPSLIANSSPPAGGGTTTTCTATYNNACGTNFMMTQIGCGGGNYCDPYGDQTMANSMMSNSALSSCPAWDSECSSDPLSNINGLSSPPGATANNGEPPGNNVWSGNTYDGPWGFDAYVFGNCSGGGVYMVTDPATGKGLTAASCGESPPLTPTQWQSDWQQDSSSAYNPLVVSIGSLTAGQDIYGPAQITAYEDTAIAGGITSNLQVNGTTASTKSLPSSSAAAFSLDTLNYKDGSYTVMVSGTDSGGNTNSDSVPVYITNGDLNGDGRVNISDLAIMAAHWGQTDSNYSDGNITSQNTINISDLAVMAANWGWIK